MLKWYLVFAGIFAIGTVGASAATTSCSSVSACVFGSNSSSGIGVEGSSKSGFGVSGVSTSGHGINGTSASSFGVVGITTENATSTGTARAGVFGEDSSTNKKSFNSGVAGSSSYGYGVSGKSTNGYGLYGTATGSGVAIYGNTATGIGAEFQAGSTNVSSFGVIAAAVNGTGIFAYSLEGGPAIDLQVNGGQSLLLGGSGGTTIISVDGSGNEILAGSLTTSGSSTVRTRSTTGADVAAFGSRSAQPSIEDVGKGQLRNGAGYIVLDKTFASTLDPHAAYSVFITPEGDSNGVYTTQLSPRGFGVRENRGGRSSLVFDYRIVAKPFDAKAMRLPAMSVFPSLPKPAALPKLLPAPRPAV